MWEFSLNFKTENFELARQVFNTLRGYIESIEGVITSHEDNGTIRILLAVKEEYKDKLKFVLTNAVTELICTKFKNEYLNKYLMLPELDKTSVAAFKKALLNFDRETDKFIIKKNLALEDNLYIESYYHFRLKPLQVKWAELVNLSNENKEYLISRESFIDLLKFLVDNLDICEEEISIVKESEGYRIYTEDNESFPNKLISEESMVSSVIDLSPQKINLYFTEMTNAINLLERIFEERITINERGLANVKKFELN
ncbi:MAG: hypothetical protein HFI85_01310 [Clostridia bacterium]|jgi:hypothetical protein|nr:hypothetical protein [Clostridia bacterium]